MERKEPEVVYKAGAALHEQSFAEHEARAMEEAKAAKSKRRDGVSEKIQKLFDLFDRK